MNLEKYQQLTGIIIPEEKRVYYEALLKRVRAKLETLLGYTLEPQNLYIELGKTKMECICPDIPQSSDLLPPDAVRGTLKVFPYNSKDKFLHTDPFYEVYNVKLGKVLDNGQIITYKTFENFTALYMQNKIGNHIEKCETCFCNCDCKDCVQLIVDADWVDFTEDEPLPDDLLYLWCDMVDFYGDQYRNIKSESVDGHSWSKGEIKAPEEEKTALLLLRRYAGPFGSIIRMPTV